MSPKVTEALITLAQDLIDQDLIEPLQQVMDLLVLDLKLHLTGNTTLTARDFVTSPTQKNNTTQSIWDLYSTLYKTRYVQCIKSHRLCGQTLTIITR